MKIVDTNVLLYAVSERSAHHASARGWLTQALHGPEVIGMPWVTLLGFIRISTHPRVFPRPLTVAQATELVQTWLAAPAVVIPKPSARHLALLAGLLRESGTAGNLTTDAHLAALAIEASATVVTFDRDFGRFGIPVETPQT